MAKESSYPAFTFGQW